MSVLRHVNADVVFEAVDLLPLARRGAEGCPHTAHRHSGRVNTFQLADDLFGPIEQIQFFLRQM